MNRLLSPKPMASQSGLALIRIITGLFMVYHGWEVFDAVKIKEYAAWEIFKNSSSAITMVYIGKGAELVAGIMLVIGICTRLASLVLIFTMLYIAVFVGNGKIWYEDQHPFLFVLLGLVFFFTGAGKYSADNLIFKSV
ncbi:MAG: DoxX family protein [Chitinophagaceae bacterium]|nr:DoxX family protein [Chitinophagaceae bacterium]